MTLAQRELYKNYLRKHHPDMSAQQLEELTDAAPKRRSIPAPEVVLRRLQEFWEWAGLQHDVEEGHLVTPTLAAAWDRGLELVIAGQLSGQHACTNAHG